MRIAIMTDSYYPTTDGVATAVRVTKSVLESMGHQVFIIAPDPCNPKYRQDGVHYLRSIKFKTYEGYYLPIFPSNQTEIIREIRPDVIHIRGVALMALKALFASHNTGVPTVLTYDTMVTDVIDQYSPIRLPKEALVKLASIYIRQLLKHPDAVAVPTPSIGKELCDVIGAKPKRLEIIPTGIDTDYFRFNPAGRDEMRARYRLSDRKVVIFVGRLSLEKNVDIPLRSMRYMAPDVSLLIVGDGPIRKDLESLAGSLGIRNRAVFAGCVRGDDLVKHYSAADAFVSASVFETQGFTAQEAMSCGLPVACGNGRAFADFIKDGENGYLFDLDEKLCAEAMAKALNAPQSVKIASRKTAMLYGLEPTTERLVNLYEEVIETKKKTKR